MSEEFTYFTNHKVQCSKFKVQSNKLDTQDILKKVRKIEIKTRGLSQNIFAGQYHSAFKGRGMAFAEVREYQYGDDVRDIDWNVTARFHRPFVKVFEEERELTVMLMVDVIILLVVKVTDKCHPEQRQDRCHLLFRQNREIYSTEEG